ncbi:MAG: hypothetical protein ACOC1S_04485, partial [bacterium]
MSLTKKLTGIEPNRNWTGDWIWSKEDGKKENTYYYFRREFKIKDSSQNYKLYITADSDLNTFNFQKP